MALPFLDSEAMILLVGSRFQLSSKGMDTIRYLD